MFRILYKGSHTGYDSTWGCSGPLPMRKTTHQQLANAIGEVV